MAILTMVKYKDNNSNYHTHLMVTMISLIVLMCYLCIIILIFSDNTDNSRRTDININSERVNLIPNV